MRWNKFLLYLIILLAFSTSIAFLSAFYVGLTVTNLATHLFIAGLGLIVLGACLSVRLCDDIVYYHRPINPALVRDVQENPVHRGFRMGEGALACVAVGGFLLAVSALLYFLVPFLPV